MNLKDRTRPFIVYKHTTPSNKVYIGITCVDPEKRWGKGGSGYFCNKHFKNAILKYGWDNIKHEILYTDLSIEQAVEKEIELVAQYDASNPDHGYNGTLGGEAGIPSEETREKLRKSTTELWKNPEYRNKVCSSLMGHVFTKETRKKMSEIQRNLYKDRDHPLKGIPKSEEHRKKMSELRKGIPSWNKGYTKETHPSLQKISATKSGVPMSEETKQKLSEVQKHRYHETDFTPVWVNNGTTEIIVDISKQDIPDGFVRGRLDLNYVYIHKSDTDEELRLPSDQADYYLDNGWLLGPSNHRRKSIAKSRQQFNWYYDNKEFSTAELLAVYLRANGYPKIVSSTITALYNKGFSSSKIYSSLDGKIQRIEVER